MTEIHLHVVLCDTPAAELENENDTFQCVCCLDSLQSAVEALGESPVLKPGNT